MLKIRTLVKEYGARNLRVIMPAQPLLHVGSADFAAVLTPDIEFELDTRRYDPTVDEKIKLVPANQEDRLTYASRTFFSRDFEAIAAGRGGIRIMVLHIDGYTTLWYKEPAE